jgi:hypothetical protein
VCEPEGKEGRKQAKDGVGSGEGEVQREAYGSPPFLNARGDGYVDFSTLFALFFLGWLVGWLVSWLFLFLFLFCSLWVFLPSFFLSCSFLWIHLVVSYEE